jgi:hypothetical protein
MIIVRYAGINDHPAQMRMTQLFMNKESLMRWYNADKDKVKNVMIGSKRFKEEEWM